MRRLEYSTPFELLNGNKPNISHFWVFGCGAYVFIPEERCLNKLALKSEFMTFIGYAEGVKGYLFMRSPNNVVFTAAQALFDEKMFPKCPDMHHGTTPIGEQPTHEENIPLEDGDGDDWLDFDGPGQPPKHPYANE